MYSGSEAEASHLLFKMKMFGLDRRSLTLWKKLFSCRDKTPQNGSDKHEVNIPETKHYFPTCILAASSFILYFTFDPLVISWYH